MEQLNISIILVKKFYSSRQTDNVYYQDLKYEHQWREIEGNKTESIFIISISDQFYNPDTKKELVNSLQVHFRLITQDGILNDYTNPETRHIGCIQLIASMTYEAQIILRTDTSKVFDKSKFKGIELPILTKQQVFEIVQSSLPQMDKSKMPITLSKEGWVTSYIIVMFSIINDATSDQKIIIDGNKITILKKDANEIFEFIPDGLENLKKRIFEDFFLNPSMQFLHLTKEESDIFRRCSHAAYYFETERKELKNQVLQNNFFEAYERFFKS